MYELFSEERSGTRRWFYDVDTIADAHRLARALARADKCTVVICQMNRSGASREVCRYDKGNCQPVIPIPANENYLHKSTNFNFLNPRGGG